MNTDLIKFIIVFALLMFFLFRRVSLNIVMPCAALLLAVLFLLPPLEFLQVYGLSIISRATLELLLTLYVIMLLEEVMRKKGYMERMLVAMDNMFHSKKVDISLLPMLIGFLPSAGGALFSAPMVDEAAQGSALTPEDKTYLNSLYRHIMELFFPTYPCILLIAELCQVPLYTVILTMFPIAVIAFGLGFWRLRKVKSVPYSRPEGGATRGQLAAALLLTLWPLLSLILIILVFQLEVYQATLAVLVLLLLVERIPLKQLPKLLYESTNFKLLLMVVVVMAFKDVLMHCGVAEVLPAAIAQIPIPSFLIFALMAFLVDWMTGMTVAAVGIVLPLALVGIDASPLAIGVLIMVSTYVGNQLTPMHLCITLVSERFGANLRKVIVGSLPTYLAIWGLGIGLFLVLSNLG